VQTVRKKDLWMLRTTDYKQRNRTSGDPKNKQGWVTTHRKIKTFKSTSVYERILFLKSHIHWEVSACLERPEMTTSLHAKLINKGLSVHGAILQREVRWLFLISFSNTHF
jgi:hypothetical protein